MRNVLSLIVGLCCLASCGDNLPVTDNEAIIGKWYCKVAYKLDGVQTNMYMHSELFANGKRQERANVKVRGEGVRLSMVLDVSGNWRLSSETLVKTSSRRKFTSIQASGAAFEGLTDAQIERELNKQIKLEGDGEGITIRGLTSDSMDMVVMIGSKSHTSNCKRPDAV